MAASTGFAQTPDARLEAIKKEIPARVDARAKLAQEMVDSVFSFGELGFQEYETSRYLTAILEKNGFKVERGISRVTSGVFSANRKGKIASISARPPP